MQVCASVCFCVQDFQIAFFLTASQLTWSHCLQRWSVWDLGFLCRRISDAQRRRVGEAKISKLTQVKVYLIITDKYFIWKNIMANKKNWMDDGKSQNCDQWCMCGCTKTDKDSILLTKWVNITGRFFKIKILTWISVEWVREVHTAFTHRTRTYGSAL